MTDAAIETMLDYYRVSRGGAADMIAEHAATDIKALSAAIDGQRVTLNALTEQSKRLRAVVKAQDATLRKIKAYVEQSDPHIKESHARFVVGTITNMCNQVLSSEQS